MGNFKDLTVWQRARALTGALYLASEHFPDDERDGLTSQIRRASVSISANLAEGSDQPSDREQARYYRIAMSSARELEALLTIASDLGFLKKAEFAEVSDELDQIQRMLNGLIRYAASGRSPKARREARRKEKNSSLESRD